MKRPLRVAVLADTLPPGGNTGVGMAQFHIAEALAKEGAQVRSFAFLELPRAWIFAVKGVTRSLLWLLAWLRRPWRRPGLRLELDTALLGALSGRVLFGKVRDWNPDWVLVPDFGAAAALWPLEWRRKLVLVDHSGPLWFLDTPAIGRRDPLDARLAWALEARMSRAARAAVAPSRYMTEVYARDYPHQGPVVAIPNMMDEAEIGRIRPTRPDLPGVKHWICLPSAGTRNKGRVVLEELLGTLARLLAPDRVAFVVTGAFDAELASRLRGLPSNAVLYAPGSLPNAENIALMKSCQVCVSPTFVESFGMALLESLYGGVPVVTFDVGATAELVADGKVGRVVPLMDVAAMARETADLLRDGARLKRWSRAAARHARVRFSGRRGGKAYARLLRSLKLP